MNKVDLLHSSISFAVTVVSYNECKKFQELRLTRIRGPNGKVDLQHSSHIFAVAVVSKGHLVLRSM